MCTCQPENAIHLTSEERTDAPLHCRVAVCVGPQERNPEKLCWPRISLTAELLPVLPPAAEIFASTVWTVHWGRLILDVTGLQESEIRLARRGMLSLRVFVTSPQSVFCVFMGGGTCQVLGLGLETLICFLAIINFLKTEAVSGFSSNKSLFVKIIPTHLLT